MRIISFLLLSLLALSCDTGPDEKAIGAFNPSHLNQLVPKLISEEKIAGVGVAVIRNGELAWSGYYGEQSPGIALSEKTAFNTASIAKTITAETLIALAAKGLIDLDESIAPIISDPDLSEDARYRLLTPRMLMSHRAGLLNWAYLYKDGRLAFDHDPDTRFSYSGAGIELAARYIEAKLGMPFSTIAEKYVLEPLDIKELSLGDVPAWAEARLAMPMDAEGRYRPVVELNPNLSQDGIDRLGAADDLIATLPAYTKLILALTKIDDWNTPEKKTLRQSVFTSLSGDAVYNCPQEFVRRCPDVYGHSVGWQVYRYGEHTVVKHSGSDAGENAFVYFSPDRRHGAIIFVNGANGWTVMTRIIEVIGDEPLIAHYYLGLINKVMGRSIKPLEAN